MSTTLMPVFATAAPQARVATEMEIRDPFLFRRARTWWMLLALFLMTQGNGLFTRQDNFYWKLKGLSSTFDSKPNLLWLTAVMAVICVGLMVKRMGPVRRLMLKQKPLLAFAILALLSSFWSQEPLWTLRRAALLALSIAFAWFFATYYSPSDQMRLLLAAGVIVALACVAMATLLPQYGIASTGEWKGIFGQKNRMGIGIFFLFAGLPFYRITSCRRLVTAVFLAFLALGLILMSQSKTALIMVAVLLAARVLGPFFARSRPEQIPFLLFVSVTGAFLAVSAVMFGLDEILSLLGRDNTLTGRTDHWALLLPFAFRHLWLGYGFEGFWTGTGDCLRIISGVGAVMKGADSGYIDTMLQFGLVGMGLLFTVLLVSVRDFVRVFRMPSVPHIAYLYAGLILVTFIGSFTELLFLAPSGITTFAFALACAGLQNLSHERALSL